MEPLPIIKKFQIEGLLQITRPTYPDDRGFFREIMRLNEIEKASGKEFAIKQANHSRSAKNTLRGIHIAPWNKIVYVSRGKVQIAIVDCRKESVTFGKHESIILGEDNRSAVFIPAGCGNSYLVLSEDADYVYLTDQEWAPDVEKSIAWNDPFIGIQWQLDVPPILSDKDQANPLFKEVFPTQ